MGRIKQGLAKILFSGVCGLGSLFCNGCYESLAISPNNNDVVLSLDSDKEYNYQSMEAGKQNEFELYRYRLRQGDLERLTHNDVFDGFPDFSPDGEFVAYISGKGGSTNYDINVMRIKDKLGRTIAKGYGPDWSPKTDQIAFIYEEKTEKKKIIEKKTLFGVEKKEIKEIDKTYHLYVSDSKGENKKEIMSSKKFYPYCWDGEGENLFYSYKDDKNIKISSFNIESNKREERFVLDNKNINIIGRMDCSPDSKYLAFGVTIRRRGEEEAKEERPLVDYEEATKYILGKGDKLFVVNLNDKSQQIIANEDSLAPRNPKFSSKGTLSVSNYCFGRPVSISLYKDKGGRKDAWVKTNNIEYTSRRGFIEGNLGWFLRGQISQKEKMIALVKGHITNKSDLCVIDAETGDLEENISFEIKKARPLKEETFFDRPLDYLGYGAAAGLALGVLGYVKLKKRRKKKNLINNENRGIK